MSEFHQNTESGQERSEVTAAGQGMGRIFIKDFSRLDCAWFNPSLGVVGQSWYVDLFVRGPLGANGFVYDFSPLKREARQILSQTLDHSLLIPIQSKHVQYQSINSGYHTGNECWQLTTTETDQQDGKPVCWQYICPKGAVYPVRSRAISREILELEMSKTLRHRLSHELTDVEVKLREEESDPTEAVLFYTHGITGHEGLCQRLFHGHRSFLEVYINDERRPDLEHYLVRDLLGQVIHIGTHAQIIDHEQSGTPKEIAVGKRFLEGGAVHLGYEGSLGTYEIRLPKSKLFVVEGETSIESIARHLAIHVKKKNKRAAKVCVIAYEGIGKGAVCEI
jgi:6-pyruvoyl-tetrahydropterin synthase